MQMKTNPILPDKHYTRKDYKLLFRRLSVLTKKYRLFFLFGIILIVLASIASGYAPKYLGMIIDLFTLYDPSNVSKSTPGEAFKAILYLPALVGFAILFFRLLVLYLLNFLFRYLGSLLITAGSQRSIYDLRQQIDQKLKTLPLSYFDQKRYGDILSRVTNDVDILSSTIQQSLEIIVSSISTILFVFGMMLYISPLLALVGLVTIPLSMFLSFFFAKSIQKYFRDQQKTLGELNGVVEESYTGHKIVAAFTAGDSVAAKFDALNDRLYTSGWKSQFYSGTLMPINLIMSNLGYIIIVVINAIQVIHGSMTIGMMQAFVQYLRQFSMPIVSLAQISTALQATAAATERIFEFLDETPESPYGNAPASSIVPNPAVPLLSFCDVRFGYTPEKTVMKQVNFHVQAGQKIAIVGPTGVGKTTLVNLLMRFYEVDAGSILLYGVDTRNLQRQELRKFFAMVLQDTWLFQGSIMENIRYARPDASDEEVITAAKAARADHFIRSLPNGYHFELSEDAANLSQGECQLLTIARAFLANRPIMILDEATSSVDTRTEVLVQDAMRNLMKGRTSFVIAHRLSTIRDSDVIFYMEDGDIKEIGNHDALLAQNGKYAALYQSQYRGENV